MNIPELSIVLPCYNESRNIPIIVERLSKYRPEINFELILVNNGSTDDTANVLTGLMKSNEFVSVVTIRENIGYGHGIMSGLKASRADIVAYSHADIQTPPDDIFRAFKMAKGNGLDIEAVMIKGERINRREDEQFLTNAYSRVSSLILGYRLHDINGQPKLFHKKFLKHLTSPPLDFSFDVYVIYKALQNNLEIVTFPVDFGLRIHGESKWASSPIKKYKTILGYFRNIASISLKNISDNNNPIKQFFKFCFVGTFGSSINYGTFYLLYKAFSIYYAISSLIGYFLAAAAIFIFNRSWTFNIKHGHISRQFVMFILLISFSFLINGLSIYFFTDKAGFRPEISQVITMAITTTINFLGSKFWVFEKKNLNMHSCIFIK